MLYASFISLFIPKMIPGYLLLWLENSKWNRIVSVQ